MAKMPAKPAKPRAMPANVAVSSRQPKILPAPKSSGPPMRASPPMKGKY